MPTSEMPRATSRALSSRLAYPVIVLGLLVIAVPMWTYSIAAAPRPSMSWNGLVFFLALLNVAAVLLPLRIEVKGETFSISLTEFPLVLGLLSGIWPPLVGPILVAPWIVVSFLRRDSWLAQLLNPVFGLTEFGVPIMLFVALRSDPNLQPLGIIVGATAGTVITSLAVNMVHRLRGATEPVLSGVMRSVVASMSTTVLAMVGFTLWNLDRGHPGSFIGRGLTVALGLALVVLYRVYARFLRQHLDLARLYDFGREVTGMVAGNPHWPELLERVRDQLNAEVAVVHLSEGGGEVISVGVDLTDRPPTTGLPPWTPQLTGDPAGERSTESADDAILRAAAEAAGAVQVSTDRTVDPELLAALDRRHAWDVLVAPMKSGDRIRGYLEVRDRRSRWARFSENDLRVLETMAQHVATALDNQRLVESLRHDAYHDAITGLLNWRGLMQETSASLDSDTIGAVLLLQLGILPEVNNAIGHLRGEQMLRLAGARVLEQMGSEAVAAHLESDRFAVLTDARSEADVEQIALRLIDSVGRSYGLDGIDVDPHVRVGIAYVDGAHSDAGELLQRAEMALTAAQSADVPIRAYGTSMGEVFRRKFHLITQFRRAVEEGRITVVYQPKLSLADRKLVGMEALVRWAHPEFGPVSPAEFVEAIETTGSIDVLLEHVLDIVLSQIAEWTRRRMRIGVAVNLSVRNLSAPDFPAKVARALADHGVSPELLTFEITESSVMADPERSLPVLRELHAMGIQLSVDDFGTGYSSLAYLRRLPIDEIKIDRSFVQGMITDLGDLAIVRAIIDLGHSLGLRVVAEGVEEEAARDALRTLRCDDLQGFLLSRPIPIEKLEAWLMSRTVRSSRDDSEAQVLRLVGS